MTDEERAATQDGYDAGYSAGSLAAWTQLLLTARQNVALATGADGLDRDQLLALHAATIIALRSICAEFGDTDWGDDLHPADIIEKHLARHLRETR